MMMGMHNDAMPVHDTTRRHEPPRCGSIPNDDVGAENAASSSTWQDVVVQACTSWNVASECLVASSMGAGCPLCARHNRLRFLQKRPPAERASSAVVSAFLEVGGF
jgi:hypothetical protein